MDVSFSFLTFDTLRQFILRGVYLSLVLTLVGTVGGLALGSLLAALRAYGPRFIGRVVIVYVDGIRSIPLLMVLLGVYLFIPKLIDAPIDATYSAAITFVLFEAAYHAEIIRSGLKGISKSQFDAALALGLRKRQAVIRVILPQIYRDMLPVFLTQIIILFQDTSLVYVISAYDLLKGFETAGRYYGQLPAGYIAAAATFLVICYLLSLAISRIQRRVQIKR